MSTTIPRSFIQQVTREGRFKGADDLSRGQWTAEPAKVSIAVAYSDEVKKEAELAYEDGYLSYCPHVAKGAVQVRLLEEFAWVTGHRWGAEYLDEEALGKSLLHAILGVTGEESGDEISLQQRRLFVAVYRTQRRMRPAGFVVSNYEEAASVPVVRT